MVRWTQLNALMPALQFSIAPWDLSEETAKLCAEAVALRKKVSYCVQFCSCWAINSSKQRSVQRAACHADSRRADHYFVHMLMSLQRILKAV